MDVEDSDHEDEERWSEPVETLEGNGLGVGHWSSHQSASIQADREPNVSASRSTGTSVYLMALNDNKAGMDGLDKEKINKIILEASRGSRFYENERKKEAQINQRIERMMSQLASITEQQKAAALQEVDAMVAELETSRSFSRSIVHLDMDAFYAAVEMRDNPSLKDKPMAVGGMSMLSTSNYHARRYGVRAAMPGFIGKKLCPELVIVPTNFDKYRTVSGQVREILGQYDPNFCPMSLDEAYFDLTDHLAMRRSFSEAQRTFPYGEWNEGGIEETRVELSDAVTGVIKESDERTCGCFGVRTDLVDGRCAHQHATLNSRNQNEAVTKSSVSREEMSSSHGNQQEMSPETKSPPEPSNSPRETPGVRNEEDSLPSGSEAVASRETRSRTFGFSVEDVVEEIRFRIEQKTQLTASAGIAPNVMLAKICSDKNKPNGHYRIQPNRNAVMEFIQPLPIRKVSGIGKVTEKLLTALGIQNCTHLYQQRALLKLLFSPISSQHFLRISLGLGSTTVERDGERKSMSTERTFRELHRPADLYSKCNELCLALAEDLQKEDLMGKTVTLKIKTVKFEVKTRAFSGPSCINSADSMFSVAKDLLRTEINACQPEPLRLRLMGVKLSNLQPCGAGESKQDSITKFFKKQAQASKRVSASDTWQEAGNVATEPVSANPMATDFSRSLTQIRSKSDLPAELNSRPGPSLSDSQLASSSSGCFNHPSNSLSHLRPEDKRFPQSSDDPASCRAPASQTRDESPASESAATSSQLVCPVCNVQQLCADLDAFNEHVDVCLNRGAIRDMLKQQASEGQSYSPQKASSPTKGKRSLPGPKSAPKRRKQEKAATNTLDKFFS